MKTDANVKIVPTQIRADERWNSRDTSAPGSPRELSDDELEESIRETGLLQPIRVRKEGGQWVLVFGFRRLKACLRIDPTSPIPCTVMPSSGDPTKDDFIARCENLAENGPRLDLRPHELADACFRLRQAHPDVIFKDLAARVGKGEEHVERLTRIRAKLCPELWEAWSANPDRFTINDLLAVCPLPHAEQVGAYNERRLSRKGGRPKGSKTAHAVNVRDVAQWREQVEEKIRLEKDVERKAFLRGMRAAFESTENGVLDWSFTPKAKAAK